MRGARECANTQSVSEAMAAIAEDERMRTLRGTRPSERKPNVDWPSTWATLMSARSNAPVVELSPIEVAYDGRYKDGK